MPFASFLRRSLLAAGLFGLLAGSCAASVEAADARQEVTIGLVDTFSPDFYIHTYAPTLDNLIEALPQYAFRIVEIDFRHLNDDIARTRPAFLVTSASTFVSLIEKTGAHQVATKKPDMSNDVAHTVASAFIVPMDSPVRTLADARGLRAAIQSRKSFDGWLIAKGEIADRFGRPDDFFRDLVVTDYGIPDVAMTVRMGLADIGILSTCEYEQLLAAGQIRPGEFRVVDAKADGMSCVRSTELYPDVVFSSFPNVDAEVTRAVKVALLSMPHQGLDFKWTIANDFLPTYGLLKKLKMGPYEPQPWTLERVWLEYRTEILLLAGLLLAVIFHVVTINLLVRKRTAQLAESLAETEHFHKVAQESRNQLLQLERSNIVSQLSSMLAHEIKQPLMSISLYAGALKLLLGKEGSLTPKAAGLIDRLESELQRSSDIVEHVRGYAKKAESKRVPVRLASVVEEAMKTLRSGVPAVVRREADPVVLADPFELQFIALNFIKNALEAVRKVSNPAVVVRISEDGGHAFLTVADNGPLISNEVFERLGKLGRSSKADGLGFGLSIAVALAEKSGGHIDFERRPGGGLSVSLTLDVLDEKPESDNGPQDKQ